MASKGGRGVQPGAPIRRRPRTDRSQPACRTRKPPACHWGWLVALDLVPLSPAYVVVEPLMDVFASRGMLRHLASA